MFLNIQFNLIFKSEFASIFPDVTQPDINYEAPDINYTPPEIIFDPNIDISSGLETFFGQGGRGNEILQGMMPDDPMDPMSSLVNSGLFTFEDGEYGLGSIWDDMIYDPSQGPATSDININFDGLFPTGEPDVPLPEPPPVSPEGVNPDSFPDLPDWLYDIIVPEEYYDPSAVGDEYGEIVEDAVFDQPILDMPPIQDFSDALMYPYYDGVLGALDMPNPYDTRRDEILEADFGLIDKNYKEAERDLKNFYGVMGLDTPAFADQAANMYDERAEAKDRVVSQYGRDAASTDESIRRNRLGDLGQVFGGEISRVRQQQQDQANYQNQANQAGIQFQAGAQAGFKDPLDYEDQGLQMGGAVGGNVMPPNVGAASTGLSNISNTAQQGISDNNKNWANASGNLFTAFNNSNQQGQQGQKNPYNDPYGNPYGINPYAQENNKG